MPILLILFIAVPITEIALFIQVGDIIGLWPTLATVILTAIVGTALVRAQGLRALSRAQYALDENRLPVEEVVTGICLLLAGAFLLTPGFLTDAIGLSLLIPPLRLWLGGWFFNYLKNHGHLQVYTNSQKPNQHHPQDPHGTQTIDGDFKDISKDP